MVKALLRMEKAIVLVLSQTEITLTAADWKLWTFLEPLLSYLGEALEIMESDNTIHEEKHIMTSMPMVTHVISQLLDNIQELKDNTQIQVHCSLCNFLFHCIQDKFCETYDAVLWRKLSVLDPRFKNTNFPLLNLDNRNSKTAISELIEEIKIDVEKI